MINPYVKVNVYLKISPKFFRLHYFRFQTIFKHDILCFDYYCIIEINLFLFIIAIIFDVIKFDNYLLKASNIKNFMIKIVYYL